jgi:hypothetical protein
LRESGECDSEPRILANESGGLIGHVLNNFSVAGESPVGNQDDLLSIRQTDDKSHTYDQYSAGMRPDNVLHW